MNSSPPNSTASFDLAPEILSALKQYEIRARLSVDHTGQVLEAWDTQLQRPVVIRQIQDLGAAGEQVLQQARLAASLKHAAFAKIHALEEVADSLLIVTEAVNGMTLKQWIQSHVGIEKKSLDHIAHIAAALTEAHQLGLVHGDIQASQFIVDQSGKIRILNCGFVSSNASYMLGSLDQIDASGGIAYLAPERFANAPASPAADVYALGCVLYEMQNGSLPFAHLQGLAMVAALVQSDPEQWPWKASLSPAESAVRKLMLDMCKRTPEQRLICAQIVEACRALRANDPYSGSVGSLSLAALRAQLEKAERRQKFYKLSAALLAIVLLAGVGWQFKPYWPQVVKALTPYSESREFESAMRSILLADQPGMLEKAEQHFTTMLAQNAANAKAVAGLSIIYSTRLNSDSRDEIWRERALASAQQALKLNPDLAMTQLALAKALDPHQQYDRAIEAIKRAKELEPNNLLVSRSEVHILLVARKYEDLSLALDVAVQKFPDDWFMSLYKGVQFIRQKKYEEAEQVLRLSTSQRSDAASPYAYLSLVMKEQGRIAEALQVLQQGLQIRPNAILYSKFAEIKFAQKEYGAAIAAWQKAVSPDNGNPGDYVAWRFLGEAFRLVPGKQAESLMAYREAQKLLEPRLSRRPNDLAHLFNMIEVSFYLGEMQRARELIDRALSLYPKNYALYVWSAMHYEKSGMRKKAIKEILTAESLVGASSEIGNDPEFSELIKDPLYLKRR